MRITRLVTFTVTAGLVGLTPIAVAAPSQAADNWTTTTTAAPDKTRIVYGESVNVVVFAVVRLVGAELCGKIVGESVGGIVVHVGGWDAP